jgi:hypothetical protein
MRITKDLLHKFAADTVKQRKRSEPDIHAAYLMGSLLSDAPLLGGTTDIDLVLVHKYLAPTARETTSLTPEISTDILHKTIADYEQPRQFRQDALIGYPLTYNHILLYDSDHWLEFLQSSVTSGFHQADNVLARVYALLASAREGWQSLNTDAPQNHLDWMDQFLQSLALGTNAIAGLIGPPLTTRRFMLTLNQRLEELGTPEIWPGFCGLLGCMEEFDIKSKPWIDAFEGDLVHLENEVTPPPHLALCRQVYYVRGIKALAQEANPFYLIWPLLRTWLDVLLALPGNSPGFDVWQDLLATLNLTEAVRDGKNRALDAFLDQIEILIETWADTYGF